MRKILFTLFLIMVSIAGYTQKHSVIDEIDRFAKENNLIDPTTNLPVQQTDKTLPFESISDKIDPKSQETPMPVMSDRELESFQEKVSSVSDYYANNIQSTSQENNHLSVSEKNNFSNESQTHARYTEEEVKQYKDAGISLGSNPEAAKEIIRKREEEKLILFLFILLSVIVLIGFIYLFTRDSNNSHVPKKVNFNNTQSPTQIGTEKDICYLTKSDAIDSKMIDDDKLSNYYDLLQDDEIPNNFKNIIVKFLLPYKISLLKYLLNKEYFDSNTLLPPVDLAHNHSYISPSLKEIKKNSMNMAMGYPGWFYIAFPDVYLWASKGYGFSLINNKYRHFEETEFVVDGIIRVEILDEIIRLYLATTKKTLECVKF